jgi:alkylation response protein AidB-like acyl-CoA dehydrogenase
MGVEYAKSREQFGVPIGSFQAVAHRLADAATEVDGAELLVREAAWAADEGLPSAPKLAVMAFLYAGETAQLAAEESLHFHGGYGFTLEYDIQLYFRRAKAWSLALAPPATEYQALADRVLGAQISA